MGLETSEARALAAIACLGGMYALFGDVLFPDEGFYLYASQAVLRGEILYRDHNYFQAPLLPYTLAPLVWLFPRSLLVPRLASAIAVAAAGWLLSRMAVEGSALSALVLIALSFNTLQTLSLPVAYGGLSSFVLVAGLATAVWPGLSPSRRAVLSGLLLGCAVGHRLTFAAAALAPLLWLRDRRQVALYGGAFLGSLACIFGPFLALDAQATIFNNWTAHQLRAAEIPLWQGLGANRSDLPRILFSVVWWNLPLLGLAVRGLWLGRRDRSIQLLALAAGLHAVAHLLPTPTWTLYYGTFVLLCAPIAGAGVPRGRLGAVVLLLAGLWNLCQGAVSGPEGVHGHAFNYMRLDRPHLARLGEFATQVPEEDRSRPVFTYMLPFAYVAGLEPISGTEMSLFGYFPGWDAERCRRHGLFNPTMLEGWMREGKCVAVIRTPFWEFAQPARQPPPGVEQALAMGYEESYVLPRSLDFPATLFLRRADPFVIEPSPEGP